MDKMREEFERWMLANYAADIPPREGDGYADTFMEFAWLAWQHLYPMVEQAYREGRMDATCNLNRENKSWFTSTAKARLEVSDD